MFKVILTFVLAFILGYVVGTFFYIYSLQSVIEGMGIDLELSFKLLKIPNKMVNLFKKEHFLFKYWQFFNDIYFNITKKIK
ncbi:MAG: hypothetical protein Q8781_00485 [Candidatus Phytoplasma stylosanthis]|uniref:hypothetical protein n=1 Tax=Candidatus Phytoplasma stylosanthis TaxID=2798314 RepID=UPI00293A9FDC|nr:hypothetical protein [Candidatus Phytoplasma stylosanthis]MDV3167971.1 hypothetical protein [Candidatus Phytoplasma stylosanthis]MDV3170772.1 hypothetical protein [Candidatus Phytoplasma stylosanthis]MDV3173761.1 hypothetical protein [Candidatus Phytoplasma stylosanthis]MDV3174284.1 hypothetical protein [Candidatus Phytoplasma stylosanthis]MDV3202739.1 hypothetical protein [Candidatus Phytoplasma stylosanthis]